MWDVESLAQKQQEPGNIFIPENTVYLLIILHMSKIAWFVIVVLILVIYHKISETDNGNGNGNAFI